MTDFSILLIGGPTASGKSALAADFAEKHNGVIINADSMQIYEGLPILTAQPNEEEKRKHPHELYAFTDPARAFSVADWLDEAKRVLATAKEKGRLPILVGGTGLYFHALLNGLAEIPDVPQEFRDEATELYEKKGEPTFREALRLVDPESADRIAPNDRQRLIRAFSVLRATGHPLSYWHKTSAQKPLYPESEIRKIALLPDRAELYAQCDKRFLSMIDAGAVEEVRAFLAHGLSPNLPVMKSLGVRELARYLREEISLDAAIAQAQQATRNYAKRQVTWFRNQWAA